MTEEGNIVKVSVIIPTYKRSTDVKKAVESACNQTLNQIEIIVVDDNEPGTEERIRTKEVITNLQKKDNRVKYIEHSRNMNGSVARNTGIKVAKGKYIAFLDDDDSFRPEKLRKQYEIIDSLPSDYAGVISNCSIVRNGVNIRTINVCEKYNALVEALSCTYQMGSGSNLFIRSDVVREVKGFDEKLLRHQDYDFMVRVFMKYGIFKIADPLFEIEQRSEHLNTPNLEKLEAAKKLYLLKYNDLISSLTTEEKKFVYFSHYISLSETAVRGKKFSKCKYYYKKAKSYIKPTPRQKLRLILLGGYSLIPRNLKKHLPIGK